MSQKLEVIDSGMGERERLVRTAEQITKASHARWTARTNIYYLCNEILGYKDVSPEVHYGLVNTLQQFPIPPRSEWLEFDKPIVKPDGSLSWKYRPYTPLLKLPGHRRRLILDFRGSLKTTTNVMAHSIQWILNYPDIAILIVHAKQSVAEDVLGEIKAHFTHNDKLRMLFPDLCPSNQEVKNFGNRERFTIPGRTEVRKEPTVGTSSIEAAVAGLHYDIIKFTDSVESENSANKDRRNVITKKFGLYRNVLVSPEYWIDVEGTRYHFDDLYGRIIDGEKNRPVHEREWKMYIRGCYKKKLPPGMEYQFSAEELELPDIKEGGKPVSWWPQRFPAKVLLQMEKDPAQEAFEFNSQMRNHPIGDLDNADFPASVVQFVPEDVIRKLHIQYYFTTVDSAETENARSNYSVITTCAWDSNNRCYVVDVRRDKMKPDELIHQIFEVYAKYKPICVRVEETSYIRGLKFGIDRELHLRGFSIPFDFVKPDNQRSKNDRIRLTLQPVLKRGDLRFSEGLPPDIREAIYQEFTQFPKGSSDDILDTLADQFQNKDFYGRLKERKSFEQVQQEHLDKWLFGEAEAPPPSMDSYYDRTGGL